MYFTDDFFFFFSFSVQFWVVQLKKPGRLITVKDCRVPKWPKWSAPRAKEPFWTCSWPESTKSIPTSSSVTISPPTTWTFSFIASLRTKFRIGRDSADCDVPTSLNRKYNFKNLTWKSRILSNSELQHFKHQNFDKEIDFFFNWLFSNFWNWKFWLGKQ